MGRKGKSLMKLGLKQAPKKIWVNTGFGSGYYKYLKLCDRDNGSCYHVTEQKGEFDEQTEIQPTLAKMGLMRNKYNQIIPIKKWHPMEYPIICECCKREGKPYEYFCDGIHRERGHENTCCIQTDYAFEPRAYSCGCSKHSTLKNCHIHPKSEVKHKLSSARIIGVPQWSAQNVVL